MAHPLKLSASLIQYDPATETLHMVCKVFIDDFERSLFSSVLRNADGSALDTQDKAKVIEAYFGEFYRIKISGKIVDLKLASTAIKDKENVLGYKSSS